MAIIEIGLRLTGFQPRIYTRPYDKIFVSGAYVADSVGTEEYRQSGFHPPGNSYREAYFGNFTYDPNLSRVKERGKHDGFLFNHAMSRYIVKDVDRILSEKPDCISIFMIGGSSAQGVGASDKFRSWNALLDQQLRKYFAGEDIIVFNAEIGGFASIQERLIPTGENARASAR